MSGFREQNEFLVYFVNFSGLYMSSIESLTKRKFLIWFLTLWTKIAIVFVPIYIGSALKFLLFDEAHFTLKMAVFRRMTAFSSYLFKNVFFYRYRKEIEGLIDLWDSSFQEKFYPENLKEKLKSSQRLNKKILILSWFITLTAALIYTLPPFFSKKKVLSHPSGIPYRQQSPDYELMVVFDFFRVIMACLSGVALDCILMVFLSHVVTQLTHLGDSLAEMTEEISADDDGKVIFKSGDQISSGICLLCFYVYFIYLHGAKVREFEEKMRIWIAHHQQVIRFFQGVKDLFTPIASQQLVYVVFYTCFTAFHLVRAKPGIDAFTIPFIAASNLISLYVWCYLGFQVEFTNSKLFEGAFGRCWFLYPIKIQKIFYFITMRGWKGLILRGISVFDLNLFTFFQVMKITYQLFAFLLQVAKEEEENKFLVYYINMFGLSMKSLYSVTDNRWIHAFFLVWTKLPLTLMPINLLWDFRGLFFDPLPMHARFAMVRKIFVICGFVTKNLFFYWKRQDFEDLIDLWDSSFKESFYEEASLVSRRNNLKRNKRLVRVSLVLGLTAALSYVIPSYFSKKKVLTHPSGIIYPHRSPEFELVVTFDLWATLACVSASAFDCILIVFLSTVHAKLIFLRDVLADIIDEFLISDEGKLLGRRDDAPPTEFVSIEGDVENTTYHKRPPLELGYEEQDWRGEEFQRRIRKVEAKLRIWVLHHQRTILFFEQLSSVYSSVASFELGAIVVYTSLTTFNIVQMKVGLVVLGVILVASSNLTSFFFWCKLSGDLMGLDAFGDGFSRAWFLFPRKIKTVFSFIIMRSKKNLCLYGMAIYGVNLVTFFEILKLAYQFSAFMIQITESE